METLLPFAAIALLIVVTPGPDMALVTRSVLSGGRHAGLLTALGIGLGAAAWAVAAVVGLAALLSAAPQVLTLIRWIGAAYLLWLGIRAVLASRTPAPTMHGEPPVAGRPWSGPLRIGLISNLLHPGQVVFYTSMLPQFIDPAAEPIPQVILLGALFVSIVLAWFTAYALLASAIRIGRWPRLAPLLSRVTGVVLIGLAIRLAARW